MNLDRCWDGSIDAALLGGDEVGIRRWGVFLNCHQEPADWCWSLNHDILPFDASPFKGILEAVENGVNATAINLTIEPNMDILPQGCTSSTSMMCNVVFPLVFPLSFCPIASPNATQTLPESCKMWEHHLKIGRDGGQRACGITRGLGGWWTQHCKSPFQPEITYVSAYRNYVYFYTWPNLPPVATPHLPSDRER